MIKYVTGDVTKVKGDTPVIIPHIVNDMATMGSGVAKALYDRWPLVRSRYIKWASDESQPSFHLGETQVVYVHHNIAVANMVAQHGIRSMDNIKPIKYDALARCMETVRIHCMCQDKLPTIHAPKFGSLRAGGDWIIIEQMINNIWGKLAVTIYEYKE